MPPYRLVWRPDDGTRNVASLPRLCQMPHTWTVVWPFRLYPLSDVPRGHAARPVCIVSRQQNLDEVEPHDGKQVEEKQRGSIFPDQCPDADLGGLDLISHLRGGPSSCTSSTLSIQRQLVLSGPARSLARSPRGHPSGARSEFPMVRVWGGPST